MLITRDRRPRDTRTTGLIPLDNLLEAHSRVAVVAAEGAGRAAWLRSKAAVGDALFVGGDELWSTPAGPDFNGIKAVFIEASPWLVRDPLGLVTIGEDVATACWSIRRDQVPEFLERGYVVAEVEPESFDPLPSEVLGSSPPEVIRHALSIPLHRATLLGSSGPIESVKALRRLTAERVIGGPASEDLVDLGRRLHGPGGKDVDPAEIREYWGVVRHLEVVLHLAGVAAPERSTSDYARAVGVSSMGAVPTPKLLPLDAEAALSCTPITVDEYGAFVDAGGYGDARWWAGFNDHPASPERFDEQRPFPDRPVVGVAFREAQAYTRWLAWVLQRPIDLPTLDLWQAACARPFPWGEERDASGRANFGQSVGELSGVLEHPDGAGPFGHLDLGGNCWEWLADPADQDRRAVVGGGWFTKLDYLRSDYSFQFDERNRFRDLGFRVASLAGTLHGRTRA